MALLNAQLPRRRCLIALDSASQPFAVIPLAVSRALYTGRPHRVVIPCGLGSNGSGCCSSGSAYRDEAVHKAFLPQGLPPLENARLEQAPAAHGPLDLWRRLLGTALSFARLAAGVLAVAVATLLLPRSAHASGRELSAAAAAAPTAAATATPHDHHRHRPSCSPRTLHQSKSHSCFASASLAASLRHTPHPSTHAATGGGSSSQPQAASVTPLAELAAATEPQYTAAPVPAPSSATATSTSPPHHNSHNPATASAASTDPLAAAVAGDDPSAAAAVAQLATSLGVTPTEAAVVRLYEQTRGSVVCVSAMRAMASLSSLDLGRLPAGQGSGVLWGDKGHVVTAHHLVKGAGEVKITLSDASTYTAKVLGSDPAKNIAVLKMSLPKSKLRDLQPVTPGSAAGLRVGQTVYGIGNPWGLGHTLSKGVVCGLGMEQPSGLATSLKGLVGVDAPPNAGHSGGVLLDSKGTLVGITVAPAGSGGLSYAVPIDAVRGLITQILSYGRTTRPALGITMAPPQVLERLGVEGVLVLEVPPGLPAHAAGLRPTHRDIFGDLVLGDVIVGMDGKPVRHAADVYDILDEHRVGDRVRLDLLRDGKATGASVTLGERTLGAVEE